jgi:hypothetical protein
MRQISIELDLGSIGFASKSHPGKSRADPLVDHRLGANPVNFAILTTGMSALTFLLLTLAVTPLRKIPG